MRAALPKRDWPKLRREGAERRADIVLLLTHHGAMNVDDLQTAFPRLSRSQLHGYLSTLKDAGKIEKCGFQSWQIPDPERPAGQARKRVYTERLAGEVPKVSLTTARQVGARRDPLVTALFGPPKEKV
jgi:hypothetical protein